MTCRVLSIVAGAPSSHVSQQAISLATHLGSETTTRLCWLGRPAPLPELPSCCAHVSTVGVDYRWPFDPVGHRQLARQARDFRPDVVHYWIGDMDAPRLGFLRGEVPSVVSFLPGAENRGLMRTTFENWLARRGTLLVAPTESFLANLLNETKRSQPTEVIPYGIGPSHDTTENLLLDELGLPAGTKLIGTMGRLQRNKRTRDLIWATDLLKIVRDDAHLVILGDGPFRWRFERYRDYLELQDRVHFLGYRPNAEQLVSCLDCYASAVVNDAPNVSLMEAMAAGKPVVAAESKVTQQLITHEESGFLVPAGDQAGFARWLNLILSDDELALRAGAAAREAIREQFAVTAMAEKYAAAYQRVTQ